MYHGDYINAIQFQGLGWLHVHRKYYFKKYFVVDKPTVIWSRPGGYNSIEFGPVWPRYHFTSDVIERVRNLHVQVRNVT